MRYMLRHRKHTHKKRVSQHYLKNKERARNVILGKAEKYSLLYGYTLKKVAIRNQKTRWGSCSEKGNLNFSYKLLFLPDHLADYIVVHEICHLQELNHSQKFWDLVAKTIPDHKRKRAELRKFRVSV